MQCGHGNLCPPNEERCTGRASGCEARVLDKVGDCCLRHLASATYFVDPIRSVVEEDGSPTTLLWRLADAVYFYMRATYPGFQGIDADAYSWLLHVACLEPDANVRRGTKVSDMSRFLRHAQIALRVRHFTRFLNEIGIEYRITHVSDMRIDSAS